MTANESAVPNAIDELKTLSKIIHDAVSTIEHVTTSQGLTFPSPYTPVTAESERPRMLPQVNQACAQAISAAYQLINDLRVPHGTIGTVAMQYSLTSCLGIAEKANVAEAIREAGQKGAHVNTIARASNIEPSKLARVLRVLATNHIFVEVAPDTFANNRVSSCLDTGKSVKDLMQSPDIKHAGTTGSTATVGHFTDEGFKASGYLQEALFDPKSATSEELDCTAFNYALNTKLSYWEWTEQPTHKRYHDRFSITMAAGKSATANDTVWKAFDWQSLKEDSLVVDVGGGMGGQTLKLAEMYPHLRFIVQDREQVVKAGTAFWDEKMPGALQSGKVTLQAHDFFQPQPVRDAAVFFMRSILHDWADKYCLDILRQLREGAAANTRLVILDSLVSYACVERDLEGIPGAARPAPPAPLLPNLGHAGIINYYKDIHMLEMLNGRERTVTHLAELMHQTGWKLVQVQHGVQTITGMVVGVPV
ncbi:S-adenosyl-L-methionine-dependent methyltransferase [Phanerochaete sordida]|uniref:S-adenosyl-L-methionine-dependent methyltransferase n=1 Tax=Phanerochaete sordida TaxID=48140 RepID=A0A9P3G358_9APHY|nr:S-adenosyl-L-methionine-dependent methyltransferase [Phanerochaete sordida]